MNHHPPPSYIMDVEDDDMPTCPLCLEELDATDRAVEACQCGYQVCLWCLHHIREQLNSRCPACRTPYQEQNFKYAEVNHEEAAKEARERATAKKERERREKIREIEKERARAAAVSQQKAKNNLKHARILQKNLVYVIGLSLTLAREDIIRRSDMFGKFGRLTRVLVNRAHPFNTDAPGGPSISAYVQYGRDSDASVAVRAMNNAVLDGREIRCAIATTKYCDAFVLNAASSDPNLAHFCGNHNCMYYHSLSQEATLSREEVLARQLGPPPPAHLFLPADTRRLHPGMRMPHSNPPTSGRPIPLRPVIHAAPNMGPSNSPDHPSSVALPNSSAPIINPPIHPVSTPFASPMPSPRHPPPFTTRNPVNTSPLHTPPSSPLTTQGLHFNRSPRGPEATPQRSSSCDHPLPAQISVPSSRLAPTSGRDGSIVGQRTSRGHARPGPSMSPDDPSRNRIPGHSLPREKPPPGFEEPSSPSVLSSALSRPPGFDHPKLSRSSTDSRSDCGASPGKNERAPLATISPPPGFGPGPTLKKEITPELSSDIAAAWSQKAFSDQIFLAKSKPATGRAIGPAVFRQVNPDDGKSRMELAQVLAKIGGDLGVSSEIHDVHTSPAILATAAKPLHPPNAATVIESTRRCSTTPGYLDSLFGNPLGSTASAPPFHSPRKTSKSITSDSGAANISTAQPCSRSFSSPLLGGSLPSPQAEMKRSTRRSNSRFGFAREDSPENSLAQTVNPSLSLPLSTPLSMKRSQESQESFQNSDVHINGVPKTEPLPCPMLASNGFSVGYAARPTLVTGRQGRSRFDFADHGSSPAKTSQMPWPGNSGTAASRVTFASQPYARSSCKPLANDGFVVSFAQLSREEKLASLFNSAQWSAEKLPPMPTVASQPDSASQAISSAAPLIDSKSWRESNDEKESRNAVPDCQHPTQCDGNEGVTTSADSTIIPFKPPGFREAAPGNTPERTVVDDPSTTAGVATTVASGGGASTAPSTKLSSDENYRNDLKTSSADSLEEERKRNSRAQRKRDKKARQLQKTNELKPSTSQEPVLMPTQPPLTSVQKARCSQVAQPVPRHAGQTVISIQAPDPGPSVPSGSIIQAQSPVEDVSVPTKQPPPLTPASDRLFSVHEPIQEANIPISSLPQENLGLFGVQTKGKHVDKFMSVSELEKEVEAARAREAHLRDKLLDLQRRIESYDSVRT